MNFATEREFRREWDRANLLEVAVDRVFVQEEIVFVAHHLPEFHLKKMSREIFIRRRIQRNDLMEN